MHQSAAMCNAQLLSWQHTSECSHASAQAAVITKQTVRSSMYVHYCGTNINVNISYSLVVAYMILGTRSMQA
jgi:hypothetical protein